MRAEAEDEEKMEEAKKKEEDMEATLKKDILPKDRVQKEFE